MTEQTSGAAVPVGMRAWHGGDSAPADWDGGPVLHQSGRVRIPFRQNDWTWRHAGPSSRGHDFDIIAYTPLAASTPALGDGEVSQGEGPSDDQIGEWLEEHCGRGLPYAEAHDLSSALHGAAYTLRQIEGTSSYKVNIGQAGPAATGIRWLLEYVARNELAHADTQTAALRAERDAVSAIALAIAAEIAAPLTGPNHGAWDRGRTGGLRDALAIIREHQSPALTGEREA